jgi:monoamine oxidase
MPVDTLIVGAGLSGLYTAYRLHQAEQSFLLLEARSRLGGRILSKAADPSLPEPSDYQYDLGPAWVWPEFQPRMAKLLSELDIPLFQQYITGDVLYEEMNSSGPHRHAGPSAHNQSYRIAGGTQALIEKLSQTLPADSVRMNSPVSKLELSDDGIKVSIHSSKKQSESLHAEQVILALPPRLIRHAISFTPELSTAQQQALDNIPTWMAGHAKILFLYDQPFWRESGLSGEVFSRKGPMTEIYDASPPSGGPYGLFGFLGIESKRRKEIGDQTLTHHCMDQLVRLFGQEARHCSATLYQDWSRESFTSTHSDANALQAHPQYGLPPILDPLWENKIILSGSETARDHGGYLEGALEAADLSLDKLNHR